jgi:hypothetical protein
MKFLGAMFWEYVQNLPIIAGFVFALHFGRQGQWLPAVASVVVGGVAGALLFGATVSIIVAGHREPVAVVLANVVMMVILSLALTLYLLAGWSSWVTDLLGGGLAGIALSAVQSRAAKETIGLGHTAAFVLAFPLGLVATRFFTTFLPPSAAAVIITTAVTLIITVVDYGPMYARGSGPQSSSEKV